MVGPEGVTMARRPAPPIDGVCVVDKPAGWTSHDVVARIRNTARERSVGHTGTLDPRAIVEARGMKQVTDAGAIEAAVDKIIAANPDKAAEARGKPAMLGWFVGQVMKETGGKANPQAVNALMRSKLGV